MRILLMVMCLLFGSGMASARVQVGVGISLPGISIGINLPYYPQLVVVPGYPVYYAPYLEMNYFFYDGMYWVYVEDNWYASYWYNGPWYLVYPDYVPLFVLRIPVYYYRRPPVYFHGWWLGAPPRWHERWGHDWERRHSGWRQWDMSATPRPAPLPDYQRDYPRDRYPDLPRQNELHRKFYRHMPRDGIVREHQQRLEERGSRPSRQWAVPAPNGSQPPAWNRETIVVPPPPEQRPQWRETPSWQQDRDENTRSVPPALQRHRVIRMEGGWQGEEKDEPEVKRFRGGSGAVVEEDQGSSMERERRPRDRQWDERRQQREGRQGR